jgi:plastocyanin
MRRMALIVSSILLTVAALTACGGGKQSPSTTSPPTSGQSSVAGMPSSSATSSPAAPAAAGQIVISNFAYTVPPSVSPGQKLTIVNNDDPNHTVTADANNLFDVVVSGGGGVMDFTAPTTPGTYPFHCKYHSNMHGVLTVQ